jgi:hypothetical protein
VSFDPAQVHSQQHLSPILGIGPAGARVDRDYRIANVVGPGQEHFGLGLFDFTLEPVDDSLQFLQGSFVFGCEFCEDGGVFNITPELVGFLSSSIEAAALAEHLLRPLLIVPEVGLRALFFYSGEFCAFGFRVKETSATPRLARLGLRISVSVRQSF